MRPSSSSTSRAIATVLALLLLSTTIAPRASAAIRTPFGFVVVVVVPPTTTQTTTTTSVDGGGGRGSPLVRGGTCHSRRRRLSRDHHPRRHPVVSGLFASTRHGKRRCDEDDCDHRGGNAAIGIVDEGDGDDDDDDNRPLVPGRGKKGSSSVVKKLGRKKSNDEPCYWHDEDDPFVIVTSENLVYGRGGYEYELGVGEDEQQQQQHHQQQQHQQRQQRHDVREDLHIPNADTNVKVINGGGNHHRRKRMKFTIRGNPRVLIRHRTARGFVYNPSRAAQETFRDRLLELLPSTFRPILTDDYYYYDGDDDEIRGVGGSSSSSLPIATPAFLFSEDESLRLSIVFRMRRPASHFVSSRRTGPGARLKSAFSAGRSSAGGGGVGHIRSDVDNLAKFVMDSLSGVVYADDRQVTSLNVVKVLDSDGPCLGATEVEICVLREEDLL